MRIIIIRILALFLLFAAATAQGVTPAASGGGRYGLALSADGTVLAWGNGGFGQLGDGRQIAFNTPAVVNGVSTIRAISSGGHQTLALGTDGTVFAWGNNAYGEIGNNSTADQLVPLALSAPTGVIAISAGWYHSVAVRNDGTVWTWGANDVGELGDGTTIFRYAPVQVTGISNVTAIATSSGDEFTMALKSDGTVWTWGSNEAGQLGDGTTNDRHVPGQVSAIAGATAIAAGQFHALALKSDGSVWAWGFNFAGQLGDGTQTDSPTPVRVAGLTDVVAIAAGYSHSLALKRDGSVWAWGKNRYGELGDGTFSTRIAPVIVSALSGVSSIAAGGEQSFAVKSDGTAWAWGYNGYGQLGDGTIVNSRNSPARVVGVSSFIAVSGGPYHTVGVARDGTVYSWGGDSYGQLGHGNDPDRVTPVVVAGMSGVIAVASGNFHSLALKGDGSVWAWGDNEYGELGDGTNLPRSSPVQVVGLPRISAIAAGTYHSLAIASDGTVWAWGRNASNQLGNPAVIGFTVTPIQVPGLSNVSQVSGGLGHSLALKSDGSVLGWGANDAGQLGDGSTVDRETPVPVVGVTDVTALSAGLGHSVAVKRDGSVWAWGGNAEGEVGDGTLINRSTPVRVTGLSGVSSVSAGWNHTLARKSDGSVWAWGYNAFGAVGDGTTTDRSTPVNLATLTDVQTVAAGGMHSMAVKADGTVRAWGTNANGQIGDGTVANRPAHVVVLKSGGAGTIAGGDWFLGLNPAITASVQAAEAPALKAVVSGSLSSTLSANIQFRLQDLGHPIYVFAYVPASLLTAAGAKDGPCVLAQVSPSGAPQQATSSTLQPSVDNVRSTQGQALTVLNRAPTGALAGSTICTGTGATSADAVSTANSTCVATVPPTTGSTVCLPPDAGATVNSPGALSGLWWNSAESGWGIHFTQRGTNVFAAWYTYDTSGNPKWYVSTCAMNGGATGTAGACNGALYEVNGPTFFTPPFNTSLVHAVNAGNLQVTFANAGNASMTYSGVMGQTRTVAITRQPLAIGAAPPIDYTDLWWAGPTESGWGMAITQQVNTMFLAWYVYDDSAKPTWYVATCTLTGTACAGSLLRTTGPPFGPTFASSQVQSFTAGTINANFTDGNNATITYTVNGVSGTKTITRQIF